MILTEVLGIMDLSKDSRYNIGIPWLHVHVYDVKILHTGCNKQGKGSMRIGSIRMNNMWQYSIVVVGGAMLR